MLTEVAGDILSAYLSAFAFLGVVTGIILFLGVLGSFRK